MTISAKAFAAAKELLWKTGHVRDPGHPELFNVTKEQWFALTSSAEPMFQLGAQSYQEYFFKELDQYAEVIHERHAVADGDVGPASEFLFAADRCGHPDYPVDDDINIDKLWSKEEANWPGECRGKLVTSRSFDALPGMNEADTSAVWWASCHNWTESIADLTMTPGAVGDSVPADFYADLERMSGGTLAWSYLARNACNVRLAQAYNEGVTWNRKLAATTKTHEDGHALGLNHVSDSSATLYPSITNASMARFGYPNATDIAAMRQIGYTPHDDWQDRRLPESRLFLPRDHPPMPPPPEDVAARVEELERQMFDRAVKDALHDVRFEWLDRRVKELEGRP